MKRALSMEDDPTLSNEKKMKKIKIEEEEEEKEEKGFVLLDEDLLFEVLKHVDSRTLATAACVSKQWNKTAHDERLWEMICTRHWANTGCANQHQLRSVVLAFGGFRLLHSLYLLPFLNHPSLSTPSSSSQSSSLFAPSMIPSKSNKMPTTTTHWGKDEVHLSLSLLSISYYGKMNLNNGGK